jgi:hypothetical protein
MIDAADRELLAASVREAVTAADSAAASDDALARVGWPEMLAAEPRDATAVVFEALGAANATAGVLDDVVSAALGVDPRADVAVVLPPFGSWDPPDRVGLATARAGTAGHLLLVRGPEPASCLVPVSAAAITVVRGIDPDAGLHTIELEPAQVGAEPLAAHAWPAAVAAGRRALAHQLAGSARAMLELARTHALERVQFGRPVARFQAVQHRLADALVAVEALDATLTVAWDEPGPMTAALAKAVAGRTAGTVARHCQQVLAGTGFTTEHPFHRFLKRTMTLDGLLGSADRIVPDLGHRLLATGIVPTLVEL